MIIRISLSSLRRTRWQDYLIRFLLGGSVSLITGMIAKEFGPVIGGLFLAFPAIFPASATLIDEQEREKKREAGISVTLRGRFAVALDARGAALGAIALAAFALLVWQELPRHETAWVLSAAMALWLITAVLLWRLRKLHVYVSRRGRRNA
ncbi:MAG TPA: DUF3147 family protein [Steroidobacteraceae bacterium]|jgi:hypothetical protein